MDERWLSVDEVAEYLGIKRGTVYKWVERYGLPVRKIGRLLKFRKSEIDEWLDGFKVPAASSPPKIAGNELGIH